MSIPAKRFEFLRKDTNVAISEFSSKLDSSILNSAENEFKMLSESLQGQIGSLTSDASGLLKEVNGLAAKGTAMVAEAQTQIAKGVSEAESMVSSMVEQATDFVSTTAQTVTSGIGNLAGQAYESVSGTLSTTFSGITDSLSGLGDIEGLSDITRSVKGMVGEVKNVLGLPNNLLDEFAGILGTGLTGFLGSGGNNAGYANTNTALTNDVKKLLKGCGANSGLGSGAPGRPYSPSINCNGNEVSIGEGGAKGAGCDAAGYGDLFGKLTGGAYQTSYRDLNKTLQALIGLSNLGHGVGMCGVFGALAKNLPQGLVSRAGAVVTATAATTSNTKAVLDMANNAPGLNFKSVIPNLTQTFLSNYTDPSDSKPNQRSGTLERVMGAVELFDSDWNVSSFDGMLSSAFGSDTSTGFKETLKVGMSNRTFSSLDQVFDSDDDFVFSSLLAA